MGWLKDMATSIGIGSLRAVALQMEAKAGSPWPADGRKPEYLANKLREADRDVDLAWWLGTGGRFVPALAYVLGEVADELREGFAARARGATGQGGIWPFAVFPALRALELDNEPLFPGIPGQLTTSGGPGSPRTWWVAPAGAGKTVLGEVLRRRWGWTTLWAADWEELVRLVPASGKVYVELSSGAGAPSDAQTGLPSGIRLCVACPSPPPRSKERSLKRGPAAPGPDGWSVVATQATESWVGELVRWVTARVRPGGGFESVGAADLVNAVAPTLATPGEVLEFLGLVDEVGVSALTEGDSANALLRPVRAWLKGAAGRPDRNVQKHVRSLISREGAQLLASMEKLRLREILPRQLSAEAWVGLIPPEVVSFDRERVLELAEEGDLDALERALRPRGRDLIDGLVSLGVLSVDAGHHEIRPSWLQRQVHGWAVSDFFASGAEGVGTLLLNPETSEVMLEELLEDVLAGRFGPIRSALDPDVHSPDQVAALDGATRALGFGALLGADIPGELASRVWRAAEPHLEQRWTNAVARIWPGVRASSDRPSLSADGGWEAARLGLSWRLHGTESELAAGPLNAWGGLPEEEGARELAIGVLDRVGWMFDPRRTDEAPFAGQLRAALFELGGATVDAHGPLTRTSRLLQIQGPDVLVGVATGAMELPSGFDERLLGLPFGLPALKAACSRRKVELETVVGWCWERWLDADWARPPFRWAEERATQSEQDSVGALWGWMPTTGVPAVFWDRCRGAPRIWRHLGPAAWDAWLEDWAGREDHLNSRAAQWFRILPEELVLTAVRRGLIGSHEQEVIGVAWSRLPGELLEFLDERALLPPTPADESRPSEGILARLVWNAPPELQGDLLERAERWLAAPQEYPGVAVWIRRWVLHAAQPGQPSWRRAYALVLASRPVG